MYQKWNLNHPKLKSKVQLIQSKGHLEKLEIIKNQFI
jgi:hypothetical protein